MRGIDSISAIVQEALRLPPANRPDFVRTACTHDDALLKEVEAQLQLESDRAWWDDSGNAFARGAEEADGTTPAGSIIGKYRVVSTLGAGGMGEVLLAERADGSFTQRVAIKMVRRSVMSPQLQGRLRLERQILAALDHPNIAKLLDGGKTGDATQYIVMEYVVGEPIDTYCDRHKLTVRERLALFRTVCAAVHYAHQNLIVHRDLKPTNILVTADGTPKLLDFGIAKLLDERQAQGTMAVTHADVRLMTPDHASPEQVRGELITTASDIYILGVLLYGLLTGRKPYALTGQLHQIERVICDEPPLPLAYGLTGRTSAADAELLQRIAQCRSTTPGQLRRELRGDLSSIVMTALRKEPERRYASAEQFAADIGRLLEDRPVTARRDTWAYRTRKFVTRYKYAAAASFAALMALIVFTASTIHQNRLIARERVRAEQVSTFLVDLFQRADPSHSRGDEITVREVLDIGSRRIDQSLSTQPDVRATLMETMGTVYGSLGLYDDSIQLLQDSLTAKQALYGVRHLEVADAMQHLGQAYVQRNDYQRAEPLLLQSMAITRDLAPDDNLRIASGLHALANLRRMQERFDEADQLFRQALELLPANDAKVVPLLMKVLNDHALLLDYRGDHLTAEKTYRRAIQLGEQSLGSDHTNPADLADLTHNLADSLAKQGHLEAAAPLFRKSLAQYRKVLGPEHPFTVMALANYGRFLQQRGDLQAAEIALREALQLDEKVRGAEHVFTGYDHGLIGFLLLEQKRPQEAAAEFRRALSIYERTLEADHLYIGSARLGLGRALVDLGAAADGEIELRKSYDIVSKAVGPDNPMTQIVGAALGHAIASQGRYAEAEPLLQRGYIASLNARGPDEPTTTRARAWIEQLYSRWGRRQEAQKFLETAH